MPRSRLVSDFIKDFPPLAIITDILLGQKTLKGGKPLTGLTQLVRDVSQPIETDAVIPYTVQPSDHVRS